MKYPEEILRERIEVLEDKLAFAESERDRYKEKFEFLVTDMLEDAHRLRMKIDEKFADFIEVLEDVERD